MCVLYSYAVCMCTHMLVCVRYSYACVCVCTHMLVYVSVCVLICVKVRGHFGGAGFPIMLGLGIGLVANVFPH